MRDKLRKHARISSLVLVASMLVLMVACGAQALVLDDLPIYPGATAIQSGQNTLADSVVTTMRQSATEQGLKAEFRLFSLPAGTTWQAVQDHYNQVMSGLKWKPEPDMTVAGEGFQAIGWSQGTGDSQHALVVGFVPDVSGEGAFAVLGLFGK